VIVTCPACNAKYQYDESRFGDSLVKRLRCSKCEAIYIVRREDAGGDEGGSTIGHAASKPDETTRELDLRKLKTIQEEQLPELAPLPRNRRYSLAVILGANSGHIYSVSTPRVYLGRGSEVDIQLPDSEVSRQHAMLEIREDAATLTDLGSTNGTYVEGVRIDKRAIDSHQEFTLGTTTLMFIVTEVQDGSVP